MRFPETLIEFYEQFPDEASGWQALRRHRPRVTTSTPKFRQLAQGLRGGIATVKTALQAMSSRQEIHQANP